MNIKLLVPLALLVHSCCLSIIAQTDKTTLACDKQLEQIYAIYEKSIQSFMQNRMDDSIKYLDASKSYYKNKYLKTCKKIEHFDNTFKLAQQTINDKVKCVADEQTALSMIDSNPIRLLKKGNFNDMLTQGEQAFTLLNQEVCGISPHTKAKALRYKVQGICLMKMDKKLSKSNEKLTRKDVNNCYARSNVSKCFQHYKVKTIEPGFSVLRLCEQRRISAINDEQ